MGRAIRPGTGRWALAAAWARWRRSRGFARDHTPTRVITRIASRAAAENQAMLPCPRGSTTRAASRAPGRPALPPTWNTDWARPCCPPEASRATRDASGWNTEEPMPTRAAAPRSTPRRGATENSSSARKVKPMPTTREYGRERRSV